MAPKTSASEFQSFAAEYERLAVELDRGAPEWLKRLRAEGLSRFVESGFPSTRDEDWRPTNLAPLARIPFRTAEPGGCGQTPDRLAAHPLASRLDGRVVVVNGRYDPLRSSPATPLTAVTRGSLAEVLRTRPDLVEPVLARVADGSRAFTALNSAFLMDGAAVVVPDGVVLQEPVEIVHLHAAGSQPTVVHPRTLIIGGANSRFSVAETYLGVDGEVYFVNAVTEIVLAENAEIEHCRVQLDGDSAYHIGALQVRQARKSRLTSLNITLGATLCRIDLGARLEGEGAESILHGLYLADDNQWADHHTCLDHAHPSCSSREVYKGILSGSARAVFSGRIIVRPDAQRTDAKQSNRNLLLSEDALVHTRPQLEIHADDVRCTHGATVGRLDEDAAFYLRSRGLSREEARQILIRAFAGEVLEPLRHQALRNHLETEIVSRLQGGRRA